MSSTWSIVGALVLNLVLGGAAFLAGAVDVSGLMTGVVLGAVVALSLGLPGFVLLALMFVLGSAATRWGYARKDTLGIAQESRGRRGWSHAVAKCIVAVFCAALAVFDVAPGAAAFKLAFAAALAAAAMDTGSSELGPLYGTRTVLLPTFRAVKPGTDGAVSAEGTLLGLLAAAVTAVVAFGVRLVPGSACWVVLVAAFVATTVESLLGSAGLGKTPAGHFLLNLSNTAVGAIVAILLGGMI